MSKLSLLLLFIVSFPAMGAYQLSEESLFALSEKGSPQLDQIEAAFLNTAVREGETKEKFAPELFGKGLYAETRERAIIQFQPIFSPVKQAQLGVRQNLASGFDTSAYISTDQRTAQSNFIGKLDNVTSTTLAFTMQMDLWKNLLGRASKAELRSMEFDRKRSELEKEIQIKAFRISLRRIYWSLVANKESMTLSDQLLKTAQKQLDEAKLRYKNSVAEADEVARYEAQLASRQGTVLYLEYQKETLLKQLRNLLPELAGQELELAPYNLDETLSNVLSCAATISAQKNVPYEFTRYDEVVAMLRQIKADKDIINKRYAGPDVKLYGAVKTTGVSSDVVKTGYTRGNYGGSFDDQLQNNRTGFDVGVNFTIPLGDTKESTQKVKELYDEKRLYASIDATEAQVATTHQQLIRSITLLQDVIKAQKTSSRELTRRLQLMKKKYEQARVSVDQLVLDQDALLSSELTTIDTQLQILNTIFDYLVIYTETPCAFNRI